MTPPVIAISLDPNDASTTLFLGHTAARMPAALRVARYADPGLWQAIGSARAIVLVRGLFEFGGVVTAARVLRIPLYYFVDDNFMLLREQAGPWSPFVERYSVENVRRQLAAFAGVLLSSQALIDYFRAERLHTALRFFPPVEWQDVLPNAGSAGDELSIAFFGGRHLHQMFSATVLPAIRRVAAERPLTLVAVGLPDRIAPSPGLTLIEQPYDAAYASGVRRLAATHVNVLVHPSPADLQNGPYKIPHALISAHALGAVPVVSDRAPYSHLRDRGVAVLCDDSSEAWYRALAALRSRSERANIQARLAEHCSSHYGGQVNQEVIEQIQAASPAAAGSRAVRARVAQGSILAGRVAARLRSGR